MRRGRPLLAALTALCLLLGLLPTAALAADAVRTTTLDLTGDVTETSGQGWRWDEDNETLTLSGANIEVADGETAGIILPDGATIVLEEGTTSTVRGAKKDGGSSYGVWCQAAPLGGSTALTIKGSGELLAYGGEGEGSYGIFGHGGVTITETAKVAAGGGGAATDGSYGIYGREGNVALSGDCVVEATGGAADDKSHGISAHDNSVTISDNAQVTATGGSVRNQTNYGSHYDGSIGISAQEKVDITGGRVIATGGNSAGTWGRSQGIYGVGGVTIKDAAEVRATGGEASSESNGIDGGKGFEVSNTAPTSAGVIAVGGQAEGKSYGIFASAVTVTDGKLDAKGGLGTGTDSTSVGIRVQTGAFPISGNSVVTATGGDAVASSAGVDVFSNDFLISNTARLTATGGSAENSYGVWAGKNSSWEKHFR